MDTSFLTVIHVLALGMNKETVGQQIKSSVRTMSEHRRKPTVLNSMYLQRF